MWAWVQKHFQVSLYDFFLNLKVENAIKFDYLFLKHPVYQFYK